MPRWDRGNKPPDDWDEEQDGWHTMTMCVPNSHQWRTVVMTAINEAASARFYTWSEGRAIEAKDIAERMLLTMAFDCNNDFTRMADNLERLIAAVAGEQVMGEDEFGDPVVLYDYTETGLTPVLDKALHIDRDIYPDLNISQVLMKGLVGRTIDFPLPFEGIGLASIADLILTMLTQMDGRFRMTDFSLDGTPFEKNLTETLETLLRSQGRLADILPLDPEFRPNIATIIEDTFNIKDNEAQKKMFDYFLKLALNKLGLDHIEVPDLQLEDKSTAEILLLMLELMQMGNIATGKLDLSTVINIINGQVCGDCGQVNGNCTCQDGPSITVEGDNSPQVEGETDNLLECGCSEE